MLLLHLERLRSCVPLIIIRQRRASAAPRRAQQKPKKQGNGKMGTTLLTSCGFRTENQFDSAQCCALKKMVQRKMDSTRHAAKSCKKGWKNHSIEPLSSSECGKKHEA
jgi:hypothetical protein